MAEEPHFLDPLRELGKVLLVLGVVLVGAGALLVRRQAAGPAWQTAGRYCVSWPVLGPRRHFLLPHRYVHLVEYRPHASHVDCEFLPSLTP